MSNFENPEKLLEKKLKKIVTINFILQNEI